jgi:hypothetical protein
MAPESVDTITALKAKHPSSPDDRRPNPVSESTEEHAYVTSAEIRKSIQTFSVGSAGGPDGMRPQVLKDLSASTNGEFGERLVGSIARFLTVVLRGGVPQGIRPLFFGANLFGFTKQIIDVRPIAVGNTTRRMASKCQGNRLAARRSESYGHLQLRYGKANGAEAAATKKYIEDPNKQRKVLVKIDFANAFNTLRRDAFLEKVGADYLEALSYSISAYGSKSFLLYGRDTVILSEDGLQQGDPEGPAIFVMPLLAW